MFVGGDRKFLFFNETIPGVLLDFVDTQISFFSSFR